MQGYGVISILLISLQKDTYREFFQTYFRIILYFGNNLRIKLGENFTFNFIILFHICDIIPQTIKPS
jgi:hypothetical protein